MQTVLDQLSSPRGPERRYGVRRQESSEIARSRAIEDENARMKRIIANVSLESDAMKELIAKTSWGPRSEKPR